MPTKDEMNNFSRTIDKIVLESDLNYIEAIIQYCEETELELEMAIKLINSGLKAKIEASARDSNLLPKIIKLPI